MEAREHAETVAARKEASKARASVLAEKAEAKRLENERKAATASAAKTPRKRARTAGDQTEAPVPERIDYGSMDESDADAEGSGDDDDSSFVDDGDGGNGFDDSDGDGAAADQPARGACEEEFGSEEKEEEEEGEEEPDDDTRLQSLIAAVAADMNSSQGAAGKEVDSEDDTLVERVHAQRYFQRSEDAMQPLAPEDMAVARGGQKDMDEDLSQACTQPLVAANSSK